MLKQVAIRDLKPNPFRRLREYPILRPKVDALKQSIANTGLWESIIGRPAPGGCVQVAFGHHRLQALAEMFPPDHRITVIVRALSDEDMLRMMAQENKREWGASGWVEVETIRATIEAYGKGLIALPPVPAKTREGLIRYVRQPTGEHAYTPCTVAEFLGWTRKDGDGLRPNYACEVAFLAIDALDDGLIRESDLIGLDLGHIQELIRGMRRIRAAEQEEAERQHLRADEARRRAERARTPGERARQEARARTYAEQARASEASAANKPERYRRRAADGFRNGDLSVHGARALASSMVDPTAKEDERVKQVDDIGERIRKRLHAFLACDDLAEDVRFVKRHRPDLSDSVAAAIVQCATSLQHRLKARIIDGIKDSPRGGRRVPPGEDQQGLDGPGHVRLLPGIAAEPGPE